jgi:AcrR family transcriptional regulator
MTAKNKASNDAGENLRAKTRSETRDKLLEAGIKIIVTQGIEKLTLDAVAREAGVSKGGLLYHFPSKEVLVVGIIVYLIEDFNADIEREMEQNDEDNPSLSWLKAYVRATFNSSQPPLPLVAGLFTAVTVNPELLEPALASFGQWQRHFDESGLDPVRAGLIRLATEGLYPTEAFGLEPIKEPLRSQLKDAILALIEKSD